VSLDAKIKESLSILDDMAAEHAPVAVFGMFSGGHDSLCAVHLASTHPAFTGAAHVNTTIGIERTRQFVRDTCARQAWPLKEYTPPVPYREIVWKHGFPGPGAHAFMYARLKERCVRALVREHKSERKDRVALVTGVRLAESTRRMGHVVPVVRAGAQVWTAPILHWTDDDKNEYMARFGLARNPIVDALCMSGECLCGAFASRGELQALKRVDPDAYAFIKQLEEEVALFGKPATWGVRPGVVPKKTKPKPGLCFSCEEKL